MEKQVFNTNSMLLLLARLLERIGYYMFYSFLYIFLIQENNIDFEVVKLFKANYFSMLIITNIIGAVIGDLILGNKKAIMLGAFFLGIGVLLITYFKSIDSNIIAALLSLGAGFFSMNFLALYGKQFLKNIKKMDGAYTLSLFIVNLGGFIGPLIAFSISQFFDAKNVFVIAAALILLSIIIISNVKDEMAVDKPKKIVLKSNSILNIIIVTVIITLYFFITDVVLKLNYSKKHIILLQNMGIIHALISIAFVVVWFNKYIKPYLKIIIGFALMLITFFVADIDTDSQEIYFATIIIILGIADIFILPALLTITTKNINSKYLATAISIVYLPYYAYKSITDKNELYNNRYLFIAIVIAIIIAVVGYYSNNNLKKKDLDLR